MCWPSIFPSGGPLKHILNHGEHKRNIVKISLLWHCRKLFASLQTRASALQSAPLWQHSNTERRDPECVAHNLLTHA